MIAAVESELVSGGSTIHCCLHWTVLHKLHCCLHAVLLWAQVDECGKCFVSSASNGDGCVWAASSTNYCHTNISAAAAAAAASLVQLQHSTAIVLYCHAIFMIRLSHYSIQAAVRSQSIVIARCELCERSPTCGTVHGVCVCVCACCLTSLSILQVSSHTLNTLYAAHCITVFYHLQRGQLTAIAVSQLNSSQPFCRPLLRHIHHVRLSGSHRPAHRPIPIIAIHAAMSITSGRTVHDIR